MRSALEKAVGVRIVRSVRSCKCVLLALLVSWSASLFTPNHALAHPELDRAVRLSSELDFDKALRAFERALSSGSLTRPELVQLLSERALLLHALRRKDDVVKDFEWLAALEPAHRLDQRAPPDLTAVWEAVRKRSRERTRLELTMLVGGGHQYLKPVVHGRKPEGLEVQTHYRMPPGSGPYQTHAGEEAIDLQQTSGGTVEAYAELLGPGGVAIDQQGTLSEPIVLSLNNVAGPGITLPESGASSSRDEEYTQRRKRRIWISTIAAVVVVGVVVGTVAATSGEDGGNRTRLMPVATF